MSEKVLAMAVSKPGPGKEKEFLKIYREMVDHLEMQGYSRDRLFRERKSKEYVLLRLWASAERAAAARKDPRVREFWKRLGKLSKIVKTYEMLEEVDLSPSQ